jgi:hypothetical protein
MGIVFDRKPVPTIVNMPFLVQVGIAFSDLTPDIVELSGSNFITIRETLGANTIFATVYSTSKIIGTF